MRNVMTLVRVFMTSCQVSENGNIGPVTKPWASRRRPHVTVYMNNPRSAQLATAAMLDRTPIAMGSDIDENVEIVTGFVQSIEEDADAVPRRWRITIREDHSQHSALVLSFLRPKRRLRLRRS
jgi:hypothetical protein